MGDLASPPEGVNGPLGKTSHPTGVFQFAEKMKKITCALCPTANEYDDVLYIAQSENIAAHENCLLFSSALVECEDWNPSNDRSFEVESVKKEIRRGRKLKCSFCPKKGATVGCDVKGCPKNYHFSCAKKDNAFLLTDESEGTYKVLCQLHAPREPQEGVKIKRKSERCNQIQPERILKQIKKEEEDDRRTDVKADFLKKCKKAGLLDHLFEEILDKLHFIQQRLMNETASESEYEEIETSLFDCRLFSDTFVNFQAVIEDKLYQYKEKQQQLKEDTELLEDLKQTLCSAKENRHLTLSPTSTSSLSLFEMATSL